MKTHRSVFYLLLTGALFIWAGFVAGISFLEAPLKFTAPHIDTVLGVGIGRIVFAALNKVEITLCALALVSAAYAKIPALIWLTLLGISGILLLQTLWLLPALDARAIALQSGQTPPESNLHFVYVGMEAVKLISLLTAAVLAFRTSYRLAVREAQEEIHYHHA
jgi:hypothetical protein